MTDEEKIIRVNTLEDFDRELGRGGEGRGREFASLLPKTTFKFFGAPLCCDKP